MGKLILSIFLFLSCIAHAQDSSFKVKKPVIIHGIFTDFAVDNLDNVYLVINGTQIKKIDKNGDSVSVYNDVKKYGNITSIDVTNAFKILIWYRESSTIVVVDRLLNMVNTIDLRKANLLQVTTIRLSYDNNIWLYDELESKIRKIDMTGRQLFESSDLRNVFSEAPMGDALFDDNSLLYLYDKKQGWLIFDYYGAFIRKYFFLDWKDVQVSNAVMFGISDSSCVYATKEDFDYKTVKFPFDVLNATKFVVTRKHFYVLNKDHLIKYEAL